MSNVTSIEDLGEDFLSKVKQENSHDERRNPVVPFFGKDLDRDSLIVFSIIIGIWVLIWTTSGLWKVLEYDSIYTLLFFMFITYVLMQIYTSGTSSGGVVYELNILLTVEQMISILFGTIVVFTIFSNNLKSHYGVHDNCMKIVFRLCVSIIIILTTASLWVNVITTGRSFRAIRKFKQGIYNVALTLFIIIGLILYRGSECI